jgi:hypothetical protein
MKVTLRRNERGDTFAIFDIPTDSSYLTFYLTPAELYECATRGRAMLSDGYHRLIAEWGRWSVFDFTASSKTGVSTMNVTVTTLDMPPRFLACVRRLLRHLELRRLQNDEDTFEHRLSVTPERMAGFVERYSQGAGQVELVTDDKTGSWLLHAMFRGGDSFARSWETLVRIAANSTKTYYQKAMLRVSSGGSQDWEDGYYWTALSPKGAPLMHGGLINHGKDGEQDWSVHT